MYNSPVVGPVATVAGVSVLPNTGGNVVLIVASIVLIVAGLAVIVTTAIRQAAKRANRA